MNSMMTLELYRHQGCWVFTDDTHGLKHEALVLGASEMVDRLYAAVYEDYTRDPVLATFSAESFPGAFRADLDGPDPEGGHWYTLAGQKAWLCGSLLSYFPEAPEQLYVRITDIY